jgi:cobalt-zinc-cadmium efflux system outer membrane protein
MRNEEHPMSLHRLLLLLLFAASSGVGAEDQPLLSLDDAVRRALEMAPQVSAQTANLEAMQALTLSAGRLPDPELVIGIDNLPVTGSDAYSMTSDFMTMRKVGVMQEFPSGAKRKLQREVADAQAGVANAELTEARLATAQQVAQAWVRRAAAEAALKDLQLLESEVDLQATAARAALASGRSSTAEALAAEAAVAQLHNRLLRMRSEVRQATAPWRQCHLSMNCQHRRRRC